MTSTFCCNQFLLSHFVGVLERMLSTVITLLKLTTKKYLSCYWHCCCVINSDGLTFTTFTRAHYWSLSQARSIQSIPHYPLSLKFILILATTNSSTFLVVFFFLAFPPITYIGSSFPLFMLPRLISSSLT
jgi:hypothetical protein